MCIDVESLNFNVCHWYRFKSIHFPLIRSSLVPNGILSQIPIQSDNEDFIQPAFKRIAGPPIRSVARWQHATAFTSTDDSPYTRQAITRISDVVFNAAMSNCLGMLSNRKLHSSKTPFESQVQG